LEAYYGVEQLGAIFLPLNIRLLPEELLYIFNDAEPVSLLVDNELYSSLVEPIRQKLKSVKEFIAIVDEEEKLFSQAKETNEYEKIIAEVSSEPPKVDIEENDVAELFYTSGTTGVPKGVMLTHRNLYLHALNAISFPVFDCHEDDVILHTIPLFHVNGWGTPQVLTCIGGTHVVLKRFDSKAVLELIQREKVTKMFLVPTMMRMLLTYPQLDKYDVGSLRLIILGGAASNADLIKKSECKLRCTVESGYGLTETSPVLTFATPKSYMKKWPDEKRHEFQSKSGIPIPGIELRIVDDEDKEIPHDGKTTGEIVVRGDQVCWGYWKKPEETEDNFIDGWFHTGDMATIDEEFNVSIVDRKKDIIISGGENISSIGVEKVIYQHPSVYECAVIGVPDEKWGEVPKAIVSLKEGMNLTEKDLLDFCRNRMASFKVPKSVEFVKEELPKGGTGKILKTELRKKYE
jgi:fatty-acyl-CoA synthase